MNAFVVRSLSNWQESSSKIVYLLPAFAVCIRSLIAKNAFIIESLDLYYCEISVEIYRKNYRKRRQNL